MAVSKTTTMTHALVAEVGKLDAADAVSALGYLIVDAANRIIDIDAASYADRAAELQRVADFCAARAEQTRACIPSADPDEDLL